MIKNVVFTIVGMALVMLIAAGAVVFLKRGEQASSAPTPIVTSPTQIENSYSMAQVSKHNNENDCWLIIQGKVYDVTKFIPDHPGGVEILRGCGKDATSLFQGEREHAEGNVAATYLPTYLIGNVQN